MLPLVSTRASARLPFSTAPRLAPGVPPHVPIVPHIAGVLRHGSRGDVLGLIVSGAEDVALECLREFDKLYPHERQHLVDWQLQLSGEDGALWTPFLDALVFDSRWEWVGERFYGWGLRSDQLDAVRNRIRWVSKWVKSEDDWVLLLPFRAYRSPILIHAVLSNARYAPVVALRELCDPDVLRLFSIARNPLLTDEAGNWMARMAYQHAKALAAQPPSFFDLLQRALAAPGCSVQRCVDVLRALECFAEECGGGPAFRIPERLESVILSEVEASEHLGGLTPAQATVLLRSTSPALRVSVLPLLATMGSTSCSTVPLDRLTRVDPQTSWCCGAALG